MQQITLTNDFHNSEVTLRLGDELRLTDRQLRRARRELCGVDGCTCAEDAAGQRGKREWVVEGDSLIPEGEAGL